MGLTYSDCVEIYKQIIDYYALYDFLKREFAENFKSLTLAFTILTLETAGPNQIKMFYNSASQLLWHIQDCVKSLQSIEC